MGALERGFPIALAIFTGVVSGTYFLFDDQSSFLTHKSGYYTFGPELAKASETQAQATQTS